MYGGSWGYYKQPTMAEIRAQSARTVAQLRAKGHDIHPVEPRSGRKLASSWWGEAWCDNLEKYADLANRIDRGKRYVRAGAVIDLQVEEGVVRAQVTGTRKKPYNVTVHIAPLSEDAKKRVLEKCANRVEGLDALLDGEFPPELKDLFTGKNGLFPTSKEISFACSCPDSASVCKHVAASLYGIGARLDDDPLLFFRLRGMDPDDLVAKAVESRVDSMLKNADVKTDRTMDDADLREVFGI